MYDLYYNLIDLDDEIINEFNSTNFDEYRLNEIQEVFFKLNRLKRKYGQSIEAIKEAKEDLEMKVAAFNNREAYLNDLKKQLDIAYQETKSIAEQITRLRQSKAKEDVYKRQLQHQRLRQLKQHRTYLNYSRL